MNSTIFAVAGILAVSLAVYMNAGIFVHILIYLNTWWFVSHQLERHEQHQKFRYGRFFDVNGVYFEVRAYLKLLCLFLDLETIQLRERTLVQSRAADRLEQLPRRCGGDYARGYSTKDGRDETKECGRLHRH